MRERLPSGFRLGNKGLSGQLALLPGGGGGTQQEDVRVARVGGLLSSWTASLLALVSGNPGWTPCLLQACCHPAMPSSTKLEWGGWWLFMQGWVS